MNPNFLTVEGAQGRREDILFSSAISLRPQRSRRLGVFLFATGPVLPRTTKSVGNT